MSDNTVTWAQLTPGQQAYLDVLARCSGGGWYRVASITSELSNGLVELGFIEQRNEVHSYYHPAARITPAGIAVWQQGQAASVPRSVWVAKCGDTIISVHTTSESSRLICEEVSGEKLEWETCDVYPDGTRRMVDSSYVYSVEEWRVLP